MKFTTTLLICIICSSSLYSQQTATFKNQAELKAEAKDIAKMQISELKNSVLLVRLKTGKNTIEAMLKAGQNQMAENRQQHIDSENSRIVKAFRTEFDFCPVYFFYSDDSKFIAEHKFDRVVFLNDSLQPDKNINITSKKFYTAEFGNVSSDTVGYYSHSTYEPNGNFSQGPVYVYYGGGTTDAKGLIIKDELFYQLRRPFPFFVKNPFFRKKQKTEIFVVRQMNNQLWEFHKRSLK